MNDPKQLPETRIAKGIIGVCHRIINETYSGKVDDETLTEIHAEIERSGEEVFRDPIEAVKLVRTGKARIMTLAALLNALGDSAQKK